MLEISDTRKSTRPTAHGVVQAPERVDGGNGGGGGPLLAKYFYKPQNRPLPSLHSLCLGVLALHLDELVEYGEHVLPLLPSEAKLSLLAAARQRHELTNSALKLLIDSSMRVLDVHSTTPKVSSSTILSAARVMAPNLKFIDLTGCVISPAFLSTLAEVAPLLEILRFGGFLAPDLEAMSDAVLKIVPKLEQADSIVDSWEEALVEEEHNSGGGGSGGGLSILSSGRLLHLRCLTWPEIPYETQILCQKVAPKVQINLTREEVLARKLPIEFDPDTELDGEYLKHVAGHENWGTLEQKHDENSISNASTVVHIADRFRMAYESQEKRLKKKDERLWRKATREVLSVSGGERAIREWEYGF
jgi:hypothetical protein